MNLIIFKFQSWDKIDIMYRVNFCFLILDLLLTTKDVYVKSLFLMQAVCIFYYHIMILLPFDVNEFGSKIEEWKNNFALLAVITLIGLPVSYLLVFGIVLTRNSISVSNHRYSQKNSQEKTDYNGIGNYQIILE